MAQKMKQFSFLITLVSLLAGCAFLQQPEYPHDPTGVQWRKDIGAYGGV